MLKVLSDPEAREITSHTPVARNPKGAQSDAFSLHISDRTPLFMESWIDIPPITSKAVSWALFQVYGLSDSSPSAAL